MAFKCRKKEREKQRVYLAEHLLKVQNKSVGTKEGASNSTSKFSIPPKQLFSLLIQVYDMPRMIKVGRVTPGMHTKFKWGKAGSGHFYGF